MTKTWKDAPLAGAGTHLNAQPMFQPAAVVVKVGLVQFPCICVGPMSTRAGPAGALEDVDEEVVVVVDPPAAVVVVVDLPEPLPPAKVVVVVEPEDVGI